jgi:hypothetical protein
MARDVEQSRAARFFARLDRHLSALANATARCGFLEHQLEGWEHRYARFVATEGASEPACDSADPPQASDFLVTIAGLAARRSALAARLTPANGQVQRFTLTPSGRPTQ